MKVLGVIPARYASTRFEGKPLADLGGKTMIQRVYEQASKAQTLSAVVVATDDVRIFKHVESFGGKVVMTAPQHRSGTDRVAEVAQKINLEIHTQNLESEALPFDKLGRKRAEHYSLVVNIQGDEPFIDPAQIDLVVGFLNKNAEFQIATLVKSLHAEVDILNPNIVKAVFTEQGRALYFSRSGIPFRRDEPKVLKRAIHYKHIGLYAFRAHVLSELAALQPSFLEQIESLEQLRWLENGYAIGVEKTDLETLGIDTPEDLVRALELLR
jgi:3-deoxy-manno-octulosonate cytidylyltransferase (CMP-KDO synthetase)